MASTLCPGVGKSSWPELLRVQGNVAKNRIERENPRVTAVIVLEGSFVTQEIDCTRVRVWVNRNGIVVQVPRVR